MALSKVGSSPAAHSFAINTNGTLNVVFTPDSTWEENDFLMVTIAAGGPNGLPEGLPTDVSVTSGWSYFTGLGPAAQFVDGQMDWTPFTHFVTPAEVGAGTITLTVTLTAAGIVDNTGLIIAMGGVAVRGGSSIKLEYIPNDDTDVDFAVSIGGTPKTGTFLDVAPYDDTWSGSAGSILYYGCGDTNTGGTSASAVWTGPTEMNDNFSQNAVGTRDYFWTSAYELLDGAADWPADSVVYTPLTGSLGMGAFRALVVLDGPGSSPEVIANPFIQRSRRVNVRALPHSVTSGMFEQADILGS